MPSWALLYSILQYTDTSIADEGLSTAVADRGASRNKDKVRGAPQLGCVWLDAVEAGICLQLRHGSRSAGYGT